MEASAPSTHPEHDSQPQQHLEQHDDKPDCCTWALQRGITIVVWTVLALVFAYFIAVQIGVYQSAGRCVPRRGARQPSAAKCEGRA